jgi:DNA replication protein DnaC
MLLLQTGVGNRPRKVSPNLRSQRFQLFSADADTVIFKKASDQDLDVEPDMKDKTELQLLKEYHRIERIYGRNNDIVKLMRDIDANRVMVFYGPVGSGRTGLVTKATSYMTERGLLQ